MVLVLNKNSKKSDLDNFLKKVEKKKKKENKGFDPKKFLGKVKSFQNIDPVKYQRELRDED